MSKKHDPTKHDAALAAAEARRQEDLASNGAYRRGVAAAKAESIANCRQALGAQMEVLKRATLTRDTNTPGRDKYDRTYKNVVAAAERLALATGEPVPGIPAYLPAPAPTPESTVTIGVPEPWPEPIPSAMKDPGRALDALPVFGSQMDAQLRSAGVVK